MDKEQYEKNLKERQDAHLAGVNRMKDINWRPCMHDNCSECVGTGVKHNGGSCVHMIACSCPKCSPTV